MKLFGIGLLAAANAGGLGNLQAGLSSQFQSYQQIQSKTTIDTNFMDKLNGYVAQDTKSHGTARGVRGVKLMPDSGECSLHWGLCPNMCNLKETLRNKFTEIVGNKMEKYQEWKTEVETKKRAITEDLVGKLDQVEGLETELGRTGADLEKQQDLFISLIEGHLERANAIHENLLHVQEDFVQIGEDLTSLGKKVVVAHDDCYEQAPCMAVPKCKLGVASGQSCAEIATNAMDVDEQGDPTLNMESGVHIIKPAGLEAKAAICEFDYQGTGFTVVQNRVNDTGRFAGDFDNGFGTTVGYDDAECAVANYYLGNKYVKKLVKSDSSLKVSHHGGSVEQWNQVSVRSDKFNLANGGHVCGANTMPGSDVKMNGGGVNGRWEAPTKVMIGKDRSPDMDMDCMEYSGGNDGGSDGGYDSSSSTYGESKSDY